MFAKTILILLLIAGILGGSAYFIHELYYKEKKLDVVEATSTPTPTPTPTPEPWIAAFESVRQFLPQTSAEARDNLEAYIASYPDSPKSPEVRAAIGRMNIALFRDPSTSAGSTVYTVVKGDSLVRIASIHKSSAELIHWANALPSINIQIGQQLLVPVIDPALVIDREKSTVTLLNGGRLFKEFPAQSIKLSGPAATGEIQTTVSDRIARKGDTRVAFGHKDYDSAERSILLATSGVVIRTPPPEPPAPAATPVPQATPADPNAPVPAAPAATPTPPPPPAPAGIVLSPEDFAELFVLVKSGTPATIK